MGLLTVLSDHYANALTNTSPDVTEFDYRLCTWGELYSSKGETSKPAEEVALLGNFPFKLVATSSDPSKFPKELVLTFRARQLLRNVERGRVVSFFQHETAEEFAAFLSVVTRRRVFPDRQLKQDGQLFEEAPYLYPIVPPQEKQQAKEIDPQEVYELLRNLRNLKQTAAESFIAATRLYHTAIQLMYARPEFSYLFLVMSLETISSADEAFEIPDPEEFLEGKYGEGWKNLWKEAHNELTTEKEKMADFRKKLGNLLVSKEGYFIRRMKQFVSKYTPDRFWSEHEDDARPIFGDDINRSQPKDLLTIRMGDSIYYGASLAVGTEQGQTRNRREELKEIVNGVYSARGGLVHKGKRLSPSIVADLHPVKPPEVVDKEIEATNSDGWTVKEIKRIPPLLKFERLVSYCLVEFLRAPGPNLNTSGAN